MWGWLCVQKKQNNKTIKKTIGNNETKQNNSDERYKIKEYNWIMQ
jgi:hypothetical protein